MIRPVGLDDHVHQPETRSGPGRGGDGPDVRLVCFDLGGVMVDICRSWAEGCERQGVDVRHDPAAEEGLRAGWDAINARHQTGRLTDEQFYAGVSDLLAGLYSPEEVRRVHDAWIIGERPGVLELVEELQVAGVGTAALSNTSSNHWGLLVELPSIARLDFRFASHRLGLVKPEAAIYRAFESETGFHGREIVFLDDSPANVAGARDAGWRAVLVDHARPAAPQIQAALVAEGVPLSV